MSACLWAKAPLSALYVNPEERGREFLRKHPHFYTLRYPAKSILDFTICVHNDTATLLTQCHEPREVLAAVDVIRNIRIRISNFTCRSDSRNHRLFS